MGSAGVAADAIALTRLQDGDAAFTLLRMTNAPFAIATLRKHLTGQRRRRPTNELHDLIDEDLLHARETGLDLPQTGKAYCDQWRNKGILVRTVTPGTREEIYELSAAAEAAIHFISQREQPRATATQSRLLTISTQLEHLVRDTDDSAESRLQALTAEREAIDAEIERVRAGDFTPTDHEAATERLEEILALAEAVPSDFARVRADLTEIKLHMQEELLKEPASRGSVLDDIFRGVDRINSSDAGRSFLGFHELLTNPEASSRLEDNIETILDREFASALDRESRTYLLTWRQHLVTESSAVRDTMVSFSRALNTFVRSRLFEEERRLSAEIRAALEFAARVAHDGNVERDFSMDLGLTGVTPSSVASWKLHNPADGRVEEDIVHHDSGSLDVAAIRAAVRETEIDMRELQESVNATLGLVDRATIGDVLVRRPATQGLASVLGLILLALEHGHRDEESIETVSWTPVAPTSEPSDKTARPPRTATIPMFVFTAPIGHEESA